MIWYDMIWYDMIWYDMIWYDMIWYNTICDEMTWYDMIKHNMIDMILYYMIWFNMIWKKSLPYDDKLLSWILTLPSLLVAQRIPLFSLFLTPFFEVYWPVPSSTRSSKVKHPLYQRIRVRPLRLRSRLVKISLSWQLLVGKSVCKIVQGTCIHRIIESFLHRCLCSLVSSTDAFFIFILSTPLVLHHLLIFKCWYSWVATNLSVALLYSFDLMLAPAF